MKKIIKKFFCRHKKANELIVCLKKNVALLECIKCKEIITVEI